MLGFRVYGFRVLEHQGDYRGAAPAQLTHSGQCLRDIARLWAKGLSSFFCQMSYSLNSLKGVI